MSHPRHHRGFTILHVLIGAMLTTVVMTALLAIVRGMYDSQQTVMGQNQADSTVRAGLDRLIDNLRTAQNNAANSNSVLSAASASAVTLYQSYYNYGTTPPTLVMYTIQYWVDTSVSPHVLRQTVVENGVTTTTAVALGVTSLALTYYKSGGVYNAANASWVTTTNPNSPTAAELPLVGAIQIAATVTTWDGYTRTLSGMVRLMNSPYVATH